MNVTGVRTTLFEIQLSRWIGDANSPSGRDRMASVAVFLETDDGLEGIALASPAARPHVGT